MSPAGGDLTTGEGRVADFGETIGKAYATARAAVELGGGVHDGQLVRRRR